jgi:hypothetical protein
METQSGGGGSGRALDWALHDVLLALRKRGAVASDAYRRKLTAAFMYGERDGAEWAPRPDAVAELVGHATAPLGAGARAVAAAEEALSALCLLLGEAPATARLFAAPAAAGALARAAVEADGVRRAQDGGAALRAAAEERAFRLARCVSALLAAAGGGEDEAAKRQFAAAALAVEGFAAAHLRAVGAILAGPDPDAGAASPGGLLKGAGELLRLMGERPPAGDAAAAAAAAAGEAAALAAAASVACRWLAGLSNSGCIRGPPGAPPADAWPSSGDAACGLAFEVLRRDGGAAAAAAMLRRPHGPAMVRALMRRLDADCLAAHPEGAEHAATLLATLLDANSKASLPWRPPRFPLWGDKRRRGWPPLSAHGAARGQLALGKSHAAPRLSPRGCGAQLWARPATARRIACALPPCGVPG